MKKAMVFTLAMMVLCTMALPLMAAGTGGSWKGWVTDSSCGAKGAKAEHKDCAKKCFDGGDKLVFYNTADQKIYEIDKQEVAKEHLGHEVTVTGTATGSSIKVETIAPTDPHAGH